MFRVAPLLKGLAVHESKYLSHRSCLPLKNMKTVPVVSLPFKLFLIAVPDINRCFGVPHDDLEGGNGNEIEAVAIADLQSCKQKCLDSAACKSLSFFPLGSTMFCKTYSVALPNTLSALEGSQHFEKNCPTGK